MFVHEVRMGKRRIAVAPEMLKPTGNLYGDEVDDAHPVLFDKDVRCLSECMEIQTN